LFGRCQMRAGKDEAVLLPAALFVNGETLPSRKGNRHAAIRNVGVADELGQQIAGWSAHGEHRRNGSAENRRDPGHIDATAACIVTGGAATNLVGRADVISARCDVERRVHSQRDDHARTTSTGTLADCATALPTEPNHVLANPPRPRLPTTTSWAYRDSRVSQRAGESQTRRRCTWTSGYCSCQPASRSLSISCPWLSYSCQSMPRIGKTATSLQACKATRSTPRRDASSK